ncbi:MAG: 50S ribosomal protein L4 [Deltaproteobacteria bacterium]|nr:50S ribosomal protein L4 [Deltaproteobacteria bacterium]
MKFDVLNVSGQKVGQVDLEDSVFGGIVKPWLFWEVVNAQRAGWRAGTQATKNATRVSGSGKKPFRQKGTGRARQGSNQAAHMVGGAVVHGPMPRSYAQSTPKKVKKGALRSALSLRTKENKLLVVSGWSPKAPKTKDARGVLAKLGAKSALVVDVKENAALMKSLRNLVTVKFLPVEGLNVYDVLDHEHLIVGEGAVAAINEKLKATTSRRDRARAEARKEG